MSAFVAMYNPALPGSPHVLAPARAEALYAAHGWLVVDGSTPAPTDIYLTPGVGDLRYDLRLTVASTASANAALAVNKHTPVDASATARTMTLPTGQTEGTRIIVEKIDTSTNTVTVSGSIRGSAGTLTLVGQSETLALIADSSGSWHPVAGHKTKAWLDSKYGAATLATDPTLRAAYGSKWQPSTAYASGEPVLNPSGVIVSAKTAFTSAASYSAANWNVVEPPKDYVAATIGTGDGTSVAFSTGSSFSTVPLNTVTYDTAGGFNTTTGIFTVATAGYYDLNAFLRPVTTASVGAGLGMGIGTVNADSPTFSWYVIPSPTGTHRTTFVYARNAHFAAGDQVRLFAYSDTAISINNASMSLSLLGRG